MAAYAYRRPRRVRYRPRGKSDSKGPAIAVAAVIALVAGSGAKAATHHSTAHATTAAIVIPSGNLSTPAGWAVALLAAEGDPRTSCDFNAVVEWERREGGGFGNQAAFNVLNVNPGPGAGWPGYSAIGAWAFPNAADGLRYTVATLNNGDYAGIIAALRAGKSAQAVCNAIENSPWAASHYGYDMTASC